MKKFLAALGVGAILTLTATTTADATPVTENVSAEVTEAVATPQAAVPNMVFVPAHSFGAQGPPHTHTSCTLGTGGGINAQCWRWFLENGAARQGSYTSLQGELPLVGVVCSISHTPTSTSQYREGWNVNPYVVGEWNSNGYHTYCQNPKYNTPLGLAGWSVNT